MSLKVYDVEFLRSITPYNDFIDFIILNLYYYLVLNTVIYIFYNDLDDLDDLSCSLLKGGKHLPQIDWNISF